MCVCMCVYMCVFCVYVCACVCVYVCVFFISLMCLCVTCVCVCVCVCETERYHPGHCYVNKNVKYFDCDGMHEHTQRLCVCVEVPGEMI